MGTLDTQAGALRSFGIQIQNDFGERPRLVQAEFHPGQLSGYEFLDYIQRATGEGKVEDQT